ncbi:uncharacterized protein LOC128679717 [Plodia interpunctella]|uniref:uncharacterized protein LOC128679717 n=1 Tax=Plodia interpunctella TaxID=58824 RepID=UPI0023679A39|nr:uncharacterized protein LOC128679717 [Plodia interpunctella]
MSEGNSKPSTSNNSGGEFTIIQRNGGAVLLRAGYQYTKKITFKSGCITWRCVNWRKKCPAYINIKENNIIKEKSHQCKPDEIKNVVDQKLHECREKVLSSNFSPIPNIYNNFMSEFENAGLDLLKKLPSFGNIKSSLYNARNKKAGVTKIQCNLPEEVIVPLQFKEFVLADYYNESSETRIIVFADSEVLEQIKHIKIYFSDGTFECCPKPIVQLYSIHGDLGSNEEHTRIVPLMYVLLNRKTEEIYTTLFQVLKEHIPDWEPLIYVTDYEQAAMNAISKVFPSVEVKGCYFHFSHNVWKKAKALNLTKEKRLRKHVALSALLPLLPREFISDGWCYLMEDSPESNEIQQFNDYMVTQWLEDENFVNIWCVHNQRHRTTNAVESWHKKLNSTLPKKPNLFQLLKVLKDDASLQKVNIKKHNFELPNPKRRLTKVIANDNWFKHVTNELLSGKITVGHCLEKLRL